MHEGDGFSAKIVRKSRFHLLTDWSGNGPAGQFWQMESALSNQGSNLSPTGLSLSFEAAVAKEDSPVTSHKYFIVPPLAFHFDHL